MALVFTEEFEGTLGTPPAGWIIPFPGPLVSTGGYHNKCVDITAGGQLWKGMGGGSRQSTTIFFAMQGPCSLAGWLQSGTSTASASYTHQWSISASDDHELMVKDGAGGLVCFGEASHHDKGEELLYSFVQLDVATAMVGTASVSVTATVRLNGEKICTGSSTFAGIAAGYDTLAITGNFGQTDRFDSLYVYDPQLAGVITTPNQGLTIAAHVSQAVLEYLNLPAAIDARISQAVLEHLDLPSASNVRVSQAVIELILAGGGGWVVYEA